MAHPKRYDPAFALRTLDCRTKWRPSDGGLLRGELMAGTDVFNISDSEFTKEVIESQQPVLVDFWATWCAPCRAIAPAVEELALQYKGRVKFAKINIDDNQETPQQYGVRSIPTLLVFKAGAVVEQIVGAVPKARLEDALKKVLEESLKKVV